jgi:hypothetical protein
MGKILTTTECKDILQISGSSYDTFINTMIPIVENFILNYCSISEDSASVQSGLKLSAANLINYQLQKPSNISNETIGNYSVSYTNSYPKDILSALKPYCRVKFIQDENLNSWQSVELESFE